MEMLDLESILFALLMAYMFLCVLVVCALVWTVILVYRITSALVRFLRPPLGHLFSTVHELMQTEEPFFARYSLGNPAYNEAQQLAFAYLIVLAHHHRR